MTEEERHELGLRIRREILGDEHVDRAIAGTDHLDEAFQSYLTGAAWADVWGREGLDRPTRSLVTIALLAALGHERELAMHLRAAARTGASREQIVEVLLHVAVYAGIPAANTAFAALKQLAAEDGTTSGEGEEPS